MIDQKQLNSFVKLIADFETEIEEKLKTKLKDPHYNLSLGSYPTLEITGNLEIEKSVSYSLIVHSQLSRPGYAYATLAMYFSDKYKSNTNLAWYIDRLEESAIKPAYRQFDEIVIYDVPVLCKNEFRLEVNVSSEKKQDLTTVFIKLLETYKEIDQHLSTALQNFDQANVIKNDAGRSISSLFLK